MMQKTNWIMIIVVSALISGCATEKPKSAASPRSVPEEISAAPAAAPAPASTKKSIENEPAIPAYSDYKTSAKITKASQEEASKRLESEERTAEEKSALLARRPQPEPVRAMPPAPAAMTSAAAPDESVVSSSTAINPEEAIKEHTPARDFCIKGARCGSGYAAYGYIIFTKRPTTNITKQRYISICNAFIGHLEPVSAYSDHIQKSQIATTFWLLTAKPKDEKSCNELIDLYDYARATEVAISINKLDSAGPLLVAWENLNPSKEGSNKQLLIDLGKFTQNDLDSAFRIWRDRISQDQRFWEKGFNTDLILAEFKSFIEKYGAKIIQTVKAS